jgi:predicted nucleic acid-binding protein
MTVIINSGPLMALAKLGLLHLLGRLYGKVAMSAGVRDVHKNIKKVSRPG